MGSKIRREFIEEGIDESIIKELKEIWEGRLFSMKICEAADILRHVYHPKVLSEVSKFDNLLFSGVYINCDRTNILNINNVESEKVRIHLGQKFKEYQDILHLLSNFYEKIPPEIEQKR